jgi:hypothetical protein
MGRKQIGKDARQWRWYQAYHAIAFPHFPEGMLREPYKL